MNKNLYKYKKRLLILCIMLALVIITTGVSYALFTSTTSQEDENSLAASCMNMEFTGKNEINLTNTYPLTEKEASSLTPYTFTITNKCDNYIEYYIVASVINNEGTADSKYIKISLSGDTDSNTNIVSNLKTIATPQSLSSYNIKQSYILKEGDGISKGESRTFNFRMWLDGDNSNTWTTEELENKTYQVKISVVGTVKTKKDDLFITTIINGEESETFPTTSDYSARVECTRNGKAITDEETSLSWDGTKWKLTASITSGNTECQAIFNEAQLLRETIIANNEVKTPLTIPGAEVSTSNEALLASAEDDYGTSYYFRGAVTNNYVQFANKCWRIVRIGGDNTVKLILHNDNIVNGSNPCSSVNNNGENAYAHYSGSTYKSSFNNENNDNAYIGFMYGTPSSTTYEATHANTNKSTILTNLETWYNNNLKSYESVIDDNVFCNDKTRNTANTFNPFYYHMTSGKFGTGYSNNATYYGATVRMVKSNHVPGGTGPSLKCNGELSKITSKIGLITIDEYAYAGGAYYKSNPTTYLEENSTSTPYWYTISPSAFYYEDDGDNESASAEIWVISTGNNNTDGEKYVTSYYGVRPYISLKSDTTIESGSGTSEAPYIINS